MLRNRIIPCLQLRGESLVKTIRFNRFGYIGDPSNTCKIFNELEVDELAFLDIMASREGRGPNLRLLDDIVDECFMPLSYGGGINSVDVAESVLKLGFEKIIVNTAAVKDPTLVRQLSEGIGSQSVMVAIDVKKDWLGRATVRGLSGRFNAHKSPREWAEEVEKMGAGEILLTSIDHEGTWDGFDLGLIQSVTEAVSVPVIAHGGASQLSDIGKAIHEGGASAVGLGNMVVFQKPGMGVLVNFPTQNQLEAVLK